LQLSERYPVVRLTHIIRKFEKDMPRVKQRIVRGRIFFADLPAGRQVFIHYMYLLNKEAKASERSENEGKYCASPYYDLSL